MSRHAGAFRGQHLLLDAADRQHIAAERDLAGHRRQRTHRTVGQQRDQRGRHGHAGRRSVLRNRSRRHVDVDVVIGEEISRRSPARLAFERTQVSAACIDSLHHLADLPGHGEAALALHLVGFDEEHVAARRRPGQAHRHAGALGALGDFAFGTDLDAAQNSVCCTSSGVTTSLSVLPSAMRRACLRQIVPIVRSRLRTPASRV